MTATKMPPARVVNTPQLCIIRADAIDSYLVSDLRLRILCILGTEMPERHADWWHELKERLGQDYRERYDYEEHLEDALAALDDAGYAFRRENGTYAAHLGCDIGTVEYRPDAAGTSTYDLGSRDGISASERARLQRQAGWPEDLVYRTNQPTESGVPQDLPPSAAEDPPVTRRIAPARRSTITVATRYRILKRDSFKCVYCGRNASEVSLEIDHYTPVSAGGLNDDSNLRSACYECNAGKGATLP